MKNLIRKITIETIEIEDAITSPCEIKGYYELKPDDQIFLEELDPMFWEQFINDCLQAEKLDNLLADIIS